jgi:hypothetical protein
MRWKARKEPLRSLRASQPITVPFLSTLSAGDHLLVVDSVYTPTRNFCHGMLASDSASKPPIMTRPSGPISKSLMRPNTKLVHTEAPGSNTFEMQDIPAIAEVAHAHGALVSMDNTWATPLFFKPLDHGVDISIHAATKYPAGHSDVLIGTVSANEAGLAGIVEDLCDAGRMRRTRRQLHDPAGIAHHGREAGPAPAKHPRNRQRARIHARCRQGPASRAGELSGARALEARFLRVLRHLLDRS